MKFFKTSEPSLSPRRRQPKTVHEALSEAQAAYAVFFPAPEYTFNLFQIISVHRDRNLSPRNKHRNLQAIFQELEDDPPEESHKSMVDAFLKQFNEVRHEKLSQQAASSKPSENSLGEACQEISLPHGHVRVTCLSSEAYTGGDKLKELIWRHAEDIFPVILEGLWDYEIPKERGQRWLMGIVTKRIFSKVSASLVDESDVSGCAAVSCINFSAQEKRILRQKYDLHGYAGLHFIAYKIECVLACQNRRQWKVYKGINVCGSELDENEDFNEAVNWYKENGSLRNATQNEYKVVKEKCSRGWGSGHRAQT